MKLLIFAVANNWNKKVQKKELFINLDSEENIPWKLSVDFNKSQHLFYEKIKTDYMIESYICSCSHKEFIIKHSTENIDYICEQCGNDVFFNANDAWNHTDRFLSQNTTLKLFYVHDITHTDLYITSYYFINIPRFIDFLKEKIIFSYMPIYSLSLSNDGDLYEDYHLEYNEDIFNSLNFSLSKYLYDNDCFNIPKDDNKEKTLDKAIFFLKNKHLKNSDFYYWKDISSLTEEESSLNSALMKISSFPKSKLIKKSIYQNYINQLDDNSKYNPTFIEVFTNSFEDINILAKLLQLSVIYSTDNNTSKDGLNALLHLLKQHYKEKQILNFFNSIESHWNEYLFRDTMNEFYFAQEIIQDTFKKVSCSIESIHDEFVRCSQAERFNLMLNQTLEYTSDELKTCMKIKKYEVKLPHTGKELFVWSERLHNCLSGYFEAIKNKETMVYGFFKEDTLVFAAEIENQTIIQASAKYNNGLTDEQQDILTKWYTRFLIIQSYIRG